MKKMFLFLLLMLLFLTYEMPRNNDIQSDNEHIVRMLANKMFFIIIIHL